MRRRLIPLATLCLGAATARAQLTSTPLYQVNGLYAILQTPAGALPRLVPSWESAVHPGLAVSYGRYSLASLTYSTAGASVWIPLARWLRLGGTFGHRTCEGCEGSYMESVDLDARLYHKQAEHVGDANTDVGLQLSGGYGKARVSDFRARSVFVSIPFGITLPQSNDTKLSLYVSPGVAYGRLDSASVTTGGLTRVLIGAGAAWKFPAGFGAHVAAHRVMAGDSPTQLGLSGSWTFGLRRHDEP